MTFTPTAPMEKRVEIAKMPTSRAGTWNRGFTLIELSIIIVLIGIVFLFALPKLDNLGDAGLRTTSRRLAGTIQSLFDESILKKEPYQMIFDITEKSYYITGRGAEGDMDEESLEVIDITKESISLPDRIYIKDIVSLIDGKIAEGKVNIRFYPDGYVDKKIIHISNGKKDFTLVTTPLTGRVKVLKGYIEITEEG